MIVECGQGAAESRCFGLRALTVWMALLGSLGAGACGGLADPHTSDDTTRTDSVGVEIVSVPLESLPTLDWTISVDPILQLGAVAGEEASQFQAISYTGVMDDSVLVVLAFGANELRFFDTDGDLISRFGGRGDGPNEFQRPQFAGYVDRTDDLGPSVRIFDSLRRRIVDVSPFTGYEREVHLPPEDAYDRIWSLPDESLIARGTFGVGQLDENGERVLNMGFDQPEYPIVHLSPVGDHRTEVTTLLGWPETRKRSETTGNLMVFREVFGMIPVAAVSGESFLKAESQEFEIQWSRSPEGVYRITRLNAPPTPVTDAHLQRQLDVELGRVPPASRAVVEATFRENDIADVLPRIRSLLPDRTGMVWVRQWVLPGDPEGPWIVVDSTGLPIGMLSTPNDLSIREIGEDYIVGVWTDEFDVPYVRMYALERR